MGLERKQRTHRHLRHYVQKRKEKGQTMNSNPSSLLLPTPSAFTFHPSSLKRDTGGGEPWRADQAGPGVAAIQRIQPGPAA